MDPAETRLLADILGRLDDIQSGQKTIIDKLDLIEPAIKGHEIRLACIEDRLEHVEKLLGVPA